MTFGVTRRHWSRDYWIPHRPFPIGGPLEPSLYSNNGFRDIQWRMCPNVGMTLQPLNKGQGHSFWYQSISYMRIPIGYQQKLLLLDAPSSHNT